MPRDLLLYLEDIRDAIVSIRSYVGDRTFEEFVGDRMRLDAVVLRFITIGEATKQIPAEITTGYPGIEWRKIAGLRDISVHSYYAVKPTILWDIIHDHTRAPGGRGGGDDPGRRGAVEPAAPHRACTTARYDKNPSSVRIPFIVSTRVLAVVSALSASVWVTMELTS